MAIITKNLGIVSPVPADEWNASTTYQKLNIVSHNNGSYIAKQGSTGIEPGVTTNWQTSWMLLVSATGGGGSGVDVVQTTGQSTTAVMSQKAVTDELNGKAGTNYVQGNPTENGTVDLAKLKVGNTVYNVPQGGGGTTVVANPTLTGSEANLTALQVGDTKYGIKALKVTIW